MRLRPEESREPGRADQPNHQALIYAGLGDKERAWDTLTRMATLSVARTGQYLTYPELAILRGDPPLSTLRKRIGLPE